MNELTTSFPNLFIALRIFLYLPITVASREHSSSKLKLIENYLSSSMFQERLSDLAVISIKKEISEEFDLSHMIDKFATKKLENFYFK
nr:unnamed protein product [Callosobruchus chinensis]